MIVKDFPKTSWRHNRTNQVYIVEAISHLRVPEGWITAVTYIDTAGTLYTRPLEDFLDKFTKESK